MKLLCPICAILDCHSAGSRQLYSIWKPPRRHSGMTAWSGGVSSAPYKVVWTLCFAPRTSHLWAFVVSSASKRRRHWFSSGTASSRRCVTPRTALSVCPRASRSWSARTSSCRAAWRRRRLRARIDVTDSCLQLMREKTDVELSLRRLQANFAGTRRSVWKWILKTVTHNRLWAHKLCTTEEHTSSSGLTQLELDTANAEFCHVLPDSSCRILKSPLSGVSLISWSRVGWRIVGINAWGKA